MLLAVDVGNTQTHIGAFGSEGLVEHWRFSTRAGATADELAVELAGLLDLADMSLGDVEATAVSSVVPPLGAAYADVSERYAGVRCVTVGPGMRTGMPIRIDNPHEVGADRLVNAVAAYERFRGRCVVVDFGTGINFDCVSDAGEYLGGAIAPGIEISLSALAERAARIPRIDLDAPDTAIGRSSRAAIQSGVLYGFAGLVDAISRRLLDEMGGSADFVATGGLASSMVPYCEMLEEVDDLLTLRGLRLIWERNREP